MKEEYKLPVYVKSEESFERFSLELIWGNDIKAMEFGFYLIWICRYLVVYKSAVINNNYLDLVMLFFYSNEPLTLAPIFFGVVFNSLHYAIKEIISWLVSSGHFMVCCALGYYLFSSVLL
jgi:hypothetical protein